MDCWRLVSGTEAEPPVIAPPGATSAALIIKAQWVKRRDRAAALLITFISDEELHTVQAMDEDPIAIWNRLKEKYERRSEAEAKTA